MYFFVQLFFIIFSVRTTNIFSDAELNARCYSNLNINVAVVFCINELQLKPDDGITKIV